MKRTPPGASWRIKHVDKAGNSFDLVSADYPDSHMGPRSGYQRFPLRTVMDEVVVQGVLHLEQMSARTWFLCIGEDKVMITVGRDGKPKMGQWYK